MPYGSMLHITPTNSHLLAAKQKPYQQAYLLTKNIEEFSGKREDRKNTGVRQKNKRGCSKLKSNDSPGIPDREETSDIPGLPSGSTVVAFATTSPPLSRSVSVCVCMRVCVVMCV